MIEGFEKITHDEFATLRDALPMIAALIGGADGKFDSKEKHWSEKFAKIYSFSKGDPLDVFFKKVNDHFSERADAFYRHHEELDERNSYLSNELEKLNDILPKIPPIIAYRLYNSFLTFAKEVARSSGGFFRMGGIGPKEARLAKLPMIKPFPDPNDLDKDA